MSEEKQNKIAISMPFVIPIVLLTLSIITYEKDGKVFFTDIIGITTRVNNQNK